MGLKRQKAGGGSRPGDDDILLLHHNTDDVPDPGDWLLHIRTLPPSMWVLHIYSMYALMICLQHNLSDHY